MKLFQHNQQKLMLPLASVICHIKWIVLSYQSPRYLKSKNILFSYSELVRLVFKPNIIKCCTKYARMKKLLKYKLSKCITQKLPQSLRTAWLHTGVSPLPQHVYTQEKKNLRVWQTMNVRKELIPGRNFRVQRVHSLEDKINWKDIWYWTSIS